METIVRILLWVWQMPQNILGLIVGMFYVGDNGRYDLGYGHSAIVKRSGAMRGGISLGMYVIVPEGAGDNYVKHELGHCEQSKMLGWFYLFAVGLPSIVWACIHTYCAAARRKSYYWFYTERWADKLGGVSRG